MKEAKFFYGGVFLEKEDLIDSIISHEIELEYYRTEKNKKSNNSKIYGIEIIKKDYKNENIKIERNIVEYITEDKNKLNSMIDIIKRNKVLPKDLDYIIVDLLKQ